MRSHINTSLCAILLSGCQALNTSPLGPPVTTRVITDHKPTGSPVVQVLPNQDQTEWTITVTQPYEETEEIQTITRQKARRYLAWPLAPLNGLIQCPVGLLMNTFSSHESAATMREVGCMRLAGMEPLANTTEAPTTINRYIDKRQQLQPVPGAGILFRDQETQDPIQILTDTNGRAILHGIAARTIAGNLSVSVANHIVYQQDLFIAPRAWNHPQILRPLPIPLILQIVSANNMGVSAGTEDRLRQTLLAQGFIVLPPKDAQDAILDEIQFQTTGRVEDSTQVRNGRLLRPTVIVSAIRKETGPYSVTISYVTSGQHQEIMVDTIEEIGELLSGRK